jgi:hypothetical protein
LLSVASKGEPLTCEDIAAWCDCRKSYIHALEKRAIAKIRAALGFASSAAKPFTGE